MRIIIIGILMIGLALSAFLFLEDFDRIISGESLDGSGRLSTILSRLGWRKPQSLIVSKQAEKAVKEDLKEALDMWAQIDTSSSHFNTGCVYLVLQKFKKALKEFKTAIELNPDNYKAKYNWELLQKQGKGGSKAKSKPGEEKKKTKLLQSKSKNSSYSKGKGW